MIIDNLLVTSTNEFRIIQFILNKNYTTRKEISDSLKLSMPTVFQYINNLLEKGIISEESLKVSLGGRKPKAITISKGKFASIGVNITKNHIFLVFIDLCGEIKSESRIRCKYEDNLSYYLQLENYLNKFIQDFKADSKIDFTILGVGISIPGILNAEHETLIRSHTLGISNISLKSFYSLIPYNVCFDNDANCSAYAEISHMENVAYISLNNTVGGAIYLNGKLILGDKFKCAEFGHMIIQPNGKKCYCGKLGCFDSYCSAKVLLESENDTLKNFFDKLKSGDKNSLEKFDNYLNYLAIGISNIRMILDCNIIIGGDVGGYLEDYIGLLNTRLQMYNQFDNDSSYVKIGKYKTHSSAIGAAKKVTDEVLKRLPEIIS